jgi:tetratricopeptide (TPR) repeat protein
MVNQERIKRKLLIREAEGYLDLISVFDDRWQLDPHHSGVIAARAIECLDQIENPQSFLPHILFLKGQIHRVTGRYAEGAKFLEESLEIEPENLHTLLALAWCYKRLNRIDAAIEVMRDAVLLESESGITHYNLACYLALRSLAKEACHHLAIALEIDPKYRSYVYAESDFDLIRDTPDFQAALSIIV